MSFTASYTVTQTPTDCSKIKITDTSNFAGEAKNTFTARRIYLYKSDGTTIKTGDTDYIDFSFASYPSDIIYVDVDKDYSLRIKLEFVSSAPQDGSTYTAEETWGLTCNSDLFLYSIAQAVAANPSLNKDKEYYDNWSELQTEVDAAKQAVKYLDQTAAQSALDRAGKIINEANLRF